MSADKDTSLLVLLKHPKRRDILRALATTGSASPSELAEKLDEPLSNLAWHFRVLHEGGGLALVDEQQVRGSIKHTYEFNIEEPWALAMLGLDKGDEGD